MYNEGNSAIAVKKINQEHFSSLFWLLFTKKHLDIKQPNSNFILFKLLTIFVIAKSCLLILKGLG